MKTKSNTTGLLIIAFVICCMVAILGAARGSNKNIVSTESDLDKFRKSAGYDFMIPKVMYEEPNIVCRTVNGQLLEIENEHIRYRISDNIPASADILGAYGEYETDIEVRDTTTETVYRLRGTKDTIYFVNWESNGIVYGINYKPGLEFMLALKYIDVDELTTEILNNENKPISEEVRNYTLESGIYTDNLMRYTIDLGDNLSNKIKVSCSEDKTNFFIQTDKLVTVFYIERVDEFSEGDNTVLLGESKELGKYSMTYISDTDKIKTADIEKIKSSFKFI